MTSLVVHGHALKHGLTVEQICIAYRQAVGAKRVRKRDLDSEPQRYAMIGLDDAGRQIELVFAQLDEDTVLIFHANYLTKQFSKEVL